MSKDRTKRDARKLELDKRTLRHLALDDDKLRQVAGGGGESRGRGTVGISD